MEVHVARCVLGEYLRVDHLFRQRFDWQRLFVHQCQARHCQHHGFITAVAVLPYLFGIAWRCDDTFALSAVLRQRLALQEIH